MIENDHYSVGKRYAEIIESIWFTFLYASVIPLGSFIIFIGLACYYWVDKFNLLKRSTVKEGVDGKLSLRMLKLLDFTLILRPVGELIFDN